MNKPLAVLAAAVLGVAATPELSTVFGPAGGAGR